MNCPANSSESPEGSSDRLLDSIVNEFTRQMRDGLKPNVVDFQEQHPSLKERLGELLGSVAMIEKLKSTSTSESRSSTRPAFPMPSRIGEYKVVAEIGRGGMGVVYLARHQTLGRRVAIKVLPPSLATSEDRVDRFRSEAQAAAKLHHTNIVGVFGVGHNELFHYYIMDYVAGRGLDELIGGREKTEAYTRLHDSFDLQSPATIDETLEAERVEVPTDKTRYRWAAKLGGDLADALAYAHGQGVLHRDLKPANFLLGDDGVSRITDFGLAKHSNCELHLTKTGDIIGTPQYLAPESLAGHYDARSEVYCLGLTLYELLTSKPAFASGSPAEVIGNITSSRPLPIRKIDADVPVDLATVIEKAIAREPEARYGNAAAFRDDLLAFVNGRAISARRASTWQHARRWARSNPMTAALSALSLALLTLVAAATSIGYWSTADALTKLQKQTDLLHEQQTVTAAALSRAKDNEQKTAAEFARAEANVAISMEAFDEMFRQMVTQGIEDSDAWDVEGFGDLARLEMSVSESDAEFLQKLLGFYRQFAEQNADNVDLAAELARAYRRMGNIYQLINQQEQAIEAYREAVSLYEWVSLADPGSSDARMAAFQTNDQLERLLDDQATSPPPRP